MMRRSILVLLSAVVVVFVALAGIAVAGMGTYDESPHSDDSTTTTMADESTTTTMDDSDDYDDGYDDDSDDMDDSDDYDDGYDDDSDDMDDSDDYDDYSDEYDDDSSDDDYDDESMPAIEDQTKTYTVPCAGTVTVEVVDGRLMFVDATAETGWDYMVDEDYDKVKVEFYGMYDSKSTIEIELDHDQFEVKIQNDSDDCHEVAKDRTETFDIAGVGTVTAEIKDGELMRPVISADGWEYMVDMDWNKFKIEFSMGEDKAMIEVELDEYEFKVKIETDFK